MKSAPLHPLNMTEKNGKYFKNKNAFVQLISPLTAFFQTVNATD